MKYSEAVKLRQLIVKASQSLTDTEGLQGVALFPSWKSGIPVIVGQRYQYNDKLYKVVQSHTTQSDWNPTIVPALFTEVVPEGVIPVWEQPTGAQNVYMKGDKVHFPTITSPVYESLIDNNSWSPVQYAAGWKLIS